MQHPALPSRKVCCPSCRKCWRWTAFTCHPLWGQRHVHQIMPFWGWLRCNDRWGRMKIPNHFWQFSFGVPWESGWGSSPHHSNPSLSDQSSCLPLPFTSICPKANSNSRPTHELCPGDCFLKKIPWENVESIKKKKKSATAQLKKWNMYNHFLWSPYMLFLFSNCFHQLQR